MLLMELLRKVLTKSSGMDKRLLKAEIKAILNNENVRRSLRDADSETLDRIKRDLETIIGETVEIEEYCALYE